MGKTRRTLLFALVLSTACTLAPAQPANPASSAPLPQHALAGDALLAALRGGGFVLYFRHTATDFSRNDGAMNGFDDCANQRPLNEQGRRDAVMIGERVRALGLPVGQVLASPMCRTMEHARLTMGRAEPAPAMRERSGTDFPGVAALLAAPVARGDNRWLFGHGMPFRVTAGPPQLAEGEAAVLSPTGAGWVVVARLQVEDWARLGAPR